MSKIKQRIVDEIKCDYYLSLIFKLDIYKKVGLFLSVVGFIGTGFFMSKLQHVNEMSQYEGYCTEAGRFFLFVFFVGIAFVLGMAGDIMAYYNHARGK